VSKTPASTNLANAGEVRLIIGDYHAPFEHLDALEFLRAVNNYLRPGRIICVGDEADVHSISEHPVDPDGYSPGHELEAAIESLRKLAEIFPVMEIAHSNHTARPFKRAFKSGLPSRFLRSYRELLDAPEGWTWHQQIDAGDFLVEHGESYGGAMGALNTAKANMKSTAIGHSHSHAGVLYFNTIWGMNVGCLVDDKQYAFAYGKNFKQKPHIGVGYVERGVPHYLPMPMDRHYRWTGKL